MKNSIVSFNPQYGIKASSHRKEKHFMQELSIVTFEGEKYDFPIRVRLYGTMAKNYACLWIDYKDTHASGSAGAGGYGYHRTSQAVEDALLSAGIKLEKNIGGVGDQAIESALRAIAEHLGLKSYDIHSAHA